MNSFINGTQNNTQENASHGAQNSAQNNSAQNNQSLNIAQNNPATNGETAQNLHNEFVRLGATRHKLKNRMLVILPEIYESGIWKKYAGSIIEYAGKFGDIAKTTVIKRLRLEENLKDKPFLRAAIAVAGVHKVAMLAKIATPETDKSMAKKALDMSKMAVQSFAKELNASGQKNKKGDENQSNMLTGFDDGKLAEGELTENGVMLPGLGDSDCAESEPLCKAVPIIKKIELDADATFLFMKLKAKLGKNLSDKEFLKMILEERAKLEFLQKQPIARATPLAAADKKSFTDETSRYIPAQQKREAVAQTNDRCGYPNCNLPHAVIHHTDRYSDCKNHESIIPLCKIHHEFAHNSLIQNETQNPNKWRMTIARTPVAVPGVAATQVPTTKPDTAEVRTSSPSAKISRADILYRRYRRKALG